MLAACACSGVHPSDPPAAAGSIAPRLSQSGDRIVLSWVEPDAAGVPTLRFAQRNNDAWGAPKSAKACAKRLMPAAAKAFTENQ